jgi:hypothetical protein
MIAVVRCCTCSGRRREEHAQGSRETQEDEQAQTLHERKKAEKEGKEGGSELVIA